MAQVYGAGGKTVPKRGRLGTGSYWPQIGTPIFRHPGNTFPGVVVETPDHAQLTFGAQARNSIATRGSTVRTPAINPNAGFYNTATLPLAPAMVVSSVVDNNNLQPVPPRTESLQMPHERNTNSASGTSKKPQTYRTVFGASKMPTDTAFAHNPNAMYRHHAKPKPGNAVEAVKKSASTRTFARPQNPLPISGGLQSGSKRTPPASFISRGQQWMDANNSFLAGVPSAITGRTGAGRWSVVKAGVV